MKELYENALREAIEITEKNLDAFIDTFPPCEHEQPVSRGGECAVDFFLLIRACAVWRTRSQAIPCS